MWQFLVNRKSVPAQYVYQETTIDWTCQSKIYVNLCKEFFSLVFPFSQSDRWKTFWGEFCHSSNRHQLHWPGGFPLLSDHGLQVHLDWQQGGAAPRPRDRRDDQPRLGLWKETLDTGLLCWVFYIFANIVDFANLYFSISERRCGRVYNRKDRNRSKHCSLKD